MISTAIDRRKASTRVSSEIDVNFDIPSQTSDKNDDHDDFPQTSIEMVICNDATRAAA